MKTCGKCQKLKTEVDFHRAENTADGRHTVCKECRREQMRKNNHEIYAGILARLGNRCSNPQCGWINADGTRGCTDRRCLQIDHLLGGGYAEIYRGRPPKIVNGKMIFQSGTSWYYRMLRDLSLDELLSKYQLLCANCNWIKRHQDASQRGGMPHKEIA